MKPQPKFGKRPNPNRERETADMADALAVVREWTGETLDAATRNRIAAAIARRA